MIKNKLTKVLAASFFLFVGFPQSAMAQDLTVLQVIVGGSQGDPAEFDLEAIDALEQVSFSTSTIWTDGVVEFSGVPLKAFLADVAEDQSIIEMVALNDYAVSMPFSELNDDAPIIATRMNGKTMSVRDKGPFWVVFPYDQDPRYRTETVYSQSIWQLNRLRVLDNE